MKNRKDGKCFARTAPTGAVYVICHNKKELAKQKKLTDANKKKAVKQKKQYDAKLKKIVAERKKKGLPPLPKNSVKKRKKPKS